MGGVRRVREPVLLRARRTMRAFLGAEWRSGVHVRADMLYFRVRDWHAPTSIASSRSNSGEPAVSIPVSMDNCDPS